MNRASTDMGNVSLVVPSIHPYIGIGSLPAVNHQKEFAAHCVTPAADQALVDGAIGLAWTARRTRPWTRRSAGACSREAEATERSRLRM